MKPAPCSCQRRVALRHTTKCYADMQNTRGSAATDEYITVRTTRDIDTGVESGLGDKLTAFMLTNNPGGR